MSKYPILCDRLAAIQSDFYMLFKSEQETKKEDPSTITNAQSDKSRSQVDRSRFAVQEAETEYRKAKDKLNQHTIETQRVEAKASVARERIKSLKAEAAQCEKDRLEIIKQLKGMGVSVDEGRA